MAHNPITIDLIKTLDAIDRHGSFAAAAEQLHKVPSALTYTLQKCEKDLDITLFDRSGHRAEWTESARHILKEGRHILTSLDNLAHSSQRLAEGWTTQYSLAVDHVLDFSQVVPLLSKAQLDIPWVPIHIQQGTLSGTWELLINHQVDLVLAPNLSKPNASGIQTRVIGSMQMVLAVAGSHPLAAIDRAITEDDMADFPVVTVKDTARQIAPLTAGIRKRKREIMVPDMATKIIAQKQGLGIGFLPLHRIQKEIFAGELIVKELVEQPDVADIQIVAGWRQGDNDKTHQWMMQHLDLIQMQSMP
ncbi:LysR substrate-binding domain-containing protein [Salinispirillum marinum]|uniref:LysR substrate-binding domain-containing protein n=2 Tax=Saccharospirillaceae TaxID=255527 RepID=A0ABV8BIV8_9GAMM